MQYDCDRNIIDDDASVFKASRHQWLLFAKLLFVSSLIVIVIVIWFNGKNVGPANYL